jgi:hypothetical protein
MNCRSGAWHADVQETLGLAMAPSQEDKSHTKGAQEITLRDCPIACEIRSNEDCMGTEALRAYCGHGRMYAEAPGFVRSSTDNRTFGLPSDNYGLAAQVRVVPLLDRRIKRVHVDVDDFATILWPQY